ncbi:MAG: hypothetical protein ACTSQ0_02985 [Candidatus Heimdallarchaeota archaeon]
MARTTSIINNFISGELSPRLAGRTDLKNYNGGCKTIENMFIFQHGGISKRPGTRFIAAAGDSTKEVRLLSFEYSSEQAYILEFGEYYIRFYMNGGQIQYEGSAYEIVSPYEAQDLAELKFVQSADIIYITHPLYPIYKILRYGHTSWKIEEVEFYGGPFLDENDTIIETDASDVTGDIQINSSETVLNNTFDTNLDNWIDVSDDAGASVWVSGGTLKLSGDDSTKYGAVEQILDTIIDQEYTVSLGCSGEDGTLYISTETISGAPSGAFLLTQTITGSSAFYTGTYNFTATAETSYLSMSTTASAGTYIDNITVKANIFNEDQVGAFWKFRGNEVKESTISAENTFTDSIIIETSGDTFIVSLTGTWEATVTVQKSFDEGTTWLDVSNTTIPESIEVASYEDNVWWRIGVKTSDYTSGDVEARLSKLDEWGYAEITAFNSEIEFDATVIKDLPNTDATENWSESAWSDYRGYPSCIAFFGQRLIFAGSIYQPQTLWASQIDDYENFEAGTNDDEGYIYTLASSDVNTFNWMVESKVLLLGTNSAEWSFGIPNEPTTPTNVYAEKHTTYGSKNIQGILTGPFNVFIQKGGTKLRNMIWNYEQDRYLSNEESLLSEHLLKEGIKEIGFAFKPNSQLFMLSDDGNLVVCTYDPLNKIQAFYKYETDGDFESFSVIPGDDRDEVSNN